MYLWRLFFKLILNKFLYQIALDNTFMNSPHAPYINSHGYFVPNIWFSYTQIQIRLRFGVVNFKIG